jgi:hypothetical protein
MAMPAHLEAWWREHPERWSQRHRHHRGFPADGSLHKQIDWFRRQFLKLAEKASTTKELGEFLKLAFMATLRVRVPALPTKRATEASWWSRKWKHA